MNRKLTMWKKLLMVQVTPVRMKKGLATAESPDSGCRQKVQWRESAQTKPVPRYRLLPGP